MEDKKFTVKDIKKELSKTERTFLLGKKVWKVTKKQKNRMLDYIKKIPSNIKLSFKGLKNKLEERIIVADYKANEVLNEKKQQDKQKRQGEFNNAFDEKLEKLKNEKIHSNDQNIIKLMNIRDNVVYETKDFDLEKDYESALKSKIAKLKNQNTKIEEKGLGFWKTRLVYCKMIKDSAKKKRAEKKEQKKLEKEKNIEAKKRKEQEEKYNQLLEKLNEVGAKLGKKPIGIPISNEKNNSVSKKIEEENNVRVETNKEEIVSTKENQIKEAILKIEETFIKFFEENEKMIKPGTKEVYGNLAFGDVSYGDIEVVSQLTGRKLKGSVPLTKYQEFQDLLDKLRHLEDKLNLTSVAEDVKQEDQVEKEEATNLVADIEQLIEAKCKESYQKKHTGRIILFKLYNKKYNYLYDQKTKFELDDLSKKLQRAHAKILNNTKQAQERQEKLLNDPEAVRTEVVKPTDIKKNGGNRAEKVIAVILTGGIIIGAALSGTNSQKNQEEYIYFPIENKKSESIEYYEGPGKDNTIEVEEEQTMSIGSTISLKDNANIYKDIYSVNNKTKSPDRLHDTSSERVVLSLIYNEGNNSIKEVTFFDQESKEKIAGYESQGIEPIGFATIRKQDIVNLVNQVKGTNLGNISSDEIISYITSNNLLSQEEAKNFLSNSEGRYNIEDLAKVTKTFEVGGANVR